MLCQDPEKELSAFLPPGFSTPAKADCNDGVGHSGSDETEAESNPDVEK